jgi:hypothetical protein
MFWVCYECSGAHEEFSKDPVFLSSLCGAKEVHLATPGASAVAIRPDRRSATIAAAIEFAKANNILGVLLDAELLVCSSPVSAFAFTSHHRITMLTR